jgi:hypothetical protein
MKANLKIETKSGTILYDSTWIGGVDNEETNKEIEEIDKEINEDMDEMDPNTIQWKSI